MKITERDIINLEPICETVASLKTSKNNQAAVCVRARACACACVSLAVLRFLIKDVNKLKPLRGFQDGRHHRLVFPTMHLCCCYSLNSFICPSPPPSSLPPSFLPPNDLGLRSVPDVVTFSWFLWTSSSFLMALQASNCCQLPRSSH